MVSKPWQKYVLFAAFALLASLLPLPDAAAPGFADSQLRNGRVYAAKHAAEGRLRRTFEERGLAYPPKEVFLRVFKSENVLEVWVRNNRQDRFALAKTYEGCAMSGVLGPKRKQGDLQVPEGFYHISHFNPNSKFHLSLKVDYPNQSDRKLSPYADLGGDIYLHGQCASLGCVAITDPKVEELYWLCVQARNFGQARIPVHIFPARLSELKFGILQHLYSGDPKLPGFWGNLKQGYDYFEANRRLPKVSVGKDGRYVFGG